MKDPAIKAIIEQISYNVLDILTRKNMWDVAYQVLCRFEGTLETFVKSRVSKASGVFEHRYYLTPRLIILTFSYDLMEIYQNEHYFVLKYRGSFLRACGAYDALVKREIQISHLFLVIGNIFVQ